MALQIFALAGVLITAVFVFYRVQLALFSPLAKIPNAHPLAAWTGAWMLWLRYSEKVNKSMLTAHAKRGPLIRIGPMELSVNCVDEGVKTIYGNKEYMKHHFYLIFKNFGASPMFTTLDPAHHSIKRKRVATVFSKSYLQNSADLQAVLSEVLFKRFLPCLQSSPNTEEVAEDYMKIMQAVIMDITTGYSLGLENGTRYLLDRDSHNKFHKMYLASRPSSMFFAPVELPTFTKLLRGVGISTLEEDWHHSNDTVDAWLLRMCDGSEETLASPGKLLPGHNPTVYRQLKEATAKENLCTTPLTTYRTAVSDFQRYCKISEENKQVITKPRSSQQIEIAAELLDEIVAAYEVLSTSVLYICWELSRNRRVQENLRDEVRPLVVAAGENLPDAKELDKLPLLHAVIMETLRRWPANPGLEPRLTPHNATLAGYHGLPAGVRVSASPHCLHKNPEVYPEPDVWRPERWTPGLREKGRWAGNGQAEKWFFGFSSGPRMCIGNHLSLHLMKFIIASMYSRFRSEIVDDTGMDVQKDGFVGHPEAEQLLLNVKPWE